MEPDKRTVDLATDDPDATMAVIIDFLEYCKINPWEGNRSPLGVDCGSRGSRIIVAGGFVNWIQMEFEPEEAGEKDGPV